MGFFMLQPTPKAELRRIKFCRKYVKYVYESVSVCVRVRCGVRVRLRDLS